MTDDGPPTIMVPARRILVVESLGDVRKGDHLIMVANVIVAHDTSRHDLPVPVPHPEKRQAQAKTVHIDSITRDVVYNAIKELGPTSVMRISDHLKLARNDSSGRGKVGRMIASLKHSKHIQRQTDNRLKIFNYEITPASTPE